MKTKHLFLFSLPVLFVLLLMLSFSAEASSSPQIGQFQTPTAGPDGRIIYTVRDGDSCQRIALLHNVDLNQLRSLNPELDENCTVILGQKLMIGVGGPASEPTLTPGPSPTPTEVLPTPTPFGGTTEVCVLLFEDTNGNALREETELGLAGGAISVTNSLGGYSQTRNSISEIDLETEEPAYICFGEIPDGLDQLPDSEKLPEGKYTVSAAIPDGYNPTIDLSYSIEVKAGDRAFVAFGAQSQASTLDDPTADEGGGQSALLGIVGAVLLLGGAGLGWYAMRMGKSSSKVKYQ
ncbi:MAG: LysM peptidoglycan-binding domain-containing protein [Chloroflexi bacterium]|nr:LysM peptidoglycan-binding domain-containing protein [Chloroflexota bacterium]